MINGNEVIAVVPARAGSKSIPDKNIKLLAGKPLIYWPIKSALDCDYIDRVIVSTDGEKIAGVAAQCGAEVYERPAHLATDDSLVIDCLRDLISTLKSEGSEAKYMLLLEATSPLRSQNDIVECIELLEQYDSVATFTEAELNPWRAWKLENGEVKPFIDGAIPWLPRQKLPPAIQLNGAVYGFRVDLLPEDSVSLLFGKQGAVLMPADRSIDIDNETQFRMAEGFLLRKNEND
ncbi:cytidylyltransferase domain-containing protein [Pleionea sediminis]|uniref:acylneuraminate cytidylyltransferase family protein n=1 Tax=Pleionea sediminis TaxID=2569479 RepID=UPI001185B87D|nr:acylneuraminate cytidylyltransferase family protein [Pleionea sediminis]